MVARYVSANFMPSLNTVQISRSHPQMQVAESSGLGPEEWDSFVLRHDGHLLQSWDWGEFKARFGWQAERLVVRDEMSEELRGAAQVLTRRLPLGSMAYVPKGPVADPKDSGTWARLLRRLRDWGRERRVTFLKIEPDWEGEFPLAQLFEEESFKVSGRAIQPPTTIVVSLEGDEEEILKRMKPKTRYNIRLAERKGVTVREGDEGNVSLFYQLMEETRDRETFGIHEEEYYWEAWRSFAPGDNIRLLLAYYHGEPLAGLIAFAFGSRAYYLYGASSDRHRNLMPNHLLQWRAMLWARARGCTSYDLWGIPEGAGEEEEDMEEVLGRGGLWGVFRFKRGFGGRVVRHSPSYDYVYSPLLYWLGMRVYRRMRGALGAS
jgi:lipid II:glycine glycyltransferase (peptidoglycan interpeptide bridge formation enzyme)